MESSNTVYKLIGPVLVKQDLEEAKATVAKRLEYINGEMWVVFTSYRHTIPPQYELTSVYIVNLLPLTGVHG